jgi:hypothetical protein
MFRLTSPLLLLACQAWCWEPSSHFLSSSSVESRSAEQQRLQTFIKNEVEDTPQDVHAMMRVNLSMSLGRSYAAMAKNSRGRLGQEGARYILHRLFVKLHGWSVRGIAPTGDSWAPPFSVLGKGKTLPPRLRDLLEEGFGNQDFSKEELTSFAATILSLIARELSEQLSIMYHVNGKDMAAKLTEVEADDIVYSCLTLHFGGYNISSDLTLEDISAMRSAVEEAFESWSDTRSVITAARQLISPGLVDLSFSDVNKIFQQTSESSGRFVDEGTCQAMENKLVRLQANPHTGRVRLVDFYNAHVEGSSKFSESPRYLRDQGALDESNPSNPFVIIPNYLAMRSNCVNASAYYDLCCLDLCEDLLDMLERDLRAPQGSPEDIMRIFRTVDPARGNKPVLREWTKELQQKLQEVADQQGGQIPLHGRLLAQWMHFAFPTWCPYPHVSGTIMPSSPSEWKAVTGEAHIANKEEVAMIVDAGGLLSADASLGVPTCDHSEEGMCMWVSVEELVDPEKRYGQPLQSPKTQLNFLSKPPSSTVHQSKVDVFSV